MIPLLMWSNFSLFKRGYIDRDPISIYGSMKREKCEYQYFFTKIYLLY